MQRKSCIDPHAKRKKILQTSRKEDASHLAKHGWNAEMTLMLTEAARQERKIYGFNLYH